MEVPDGQVVKTVVSLEHKRSLMAEWFETMASHGCEMYSSWSGGNGFEPQSSWTWGAFVYGVLETPQTIYFFQSQLYYLTWKDPKSSLQRLLEYKEVCIFFQDLVMKEF